MIILRKKNRNETGCTCILKKVVSKILASVPNFSSIFIRGEKQVFQDLYKACLVSYNIKKSYG